MGFDSEKPVTSCCDGVQPWPPFSAGRVQPAAGAVLLLRRRTAPQLLVLMTTPAVPRLPGMLGAPACGKKHAAAANGVLLC